jgi:hypothetical protein
MCSRFSEIALLTQIDNIIRTSLSAFINEVVHSAWKGREREAISLYAFGFLQQHISAGGVLRDPTQIGIEVTVPSDTSLNPKGRVAKDLVLWPDPQMTCWDQNWEVARYPIAIMEWKTYRLASSRPTMSRTDIEWLTQYSKLCTTAFVSYAVSLDLLHRAFWLNVTRIESGHAQDRWLVL